KLYGYHVPPAAAGATYVSEGRDRRGTSARMLTGAALRPWIITTVAGACPSGTPASTTACPSCGGTSAVMHRPKRVFDGSAMRLFPGRQLELPSKGRQIFVNGEARFDRRHFEQHAARLAEIDRLKVAAVADVGDDESHLEQFVAQPPLFVV